MGGNDRNNLFIIDGRNPRIFNKYNIWQLPAIDGYKLHPLIFLMKAVVLIDSGSLWSPIFDAQRKNGHNPCRGFSGQYTEPSSFRKYVN